MFFLWQDLKITFLSFLNSNVWEMQDLSFIVFGIKMSTLLMGELFFVAMVTEINLGFLSVLRIVKKKVLILVDRNLILDSMKTDLVRFLIKKRHSLNLFCIKWEIFFYDRGRIFIALRLVS